MLFALFEATTEDITENTDEELLRLSVAHPNLFAELVHRYQAAFVRKAMTVVRNQQEAEDIVQDTFTKIYRYADRFEPQEGASFKSWGYRILMNTAFTRYQKLKRERDHVAEIEMDFYEVLPDCDMRQFEDKEIRDYVVSILVRMPDHMARVLKLYFLEKKSQQEIAELEGASVGAIKTRMHRAKTEFKNTLANLSNLSM